MDSELLPIVAAARSLVRRWDNGLARWLRQLAAPLPPALRGNEDAAVGAIEAVVGFDPLGVLAGYAAQSGVAGVDDDTGRATRKRRPLAAALLSRDERPAESAARTMRRAQRSASARVATSDGRRGNTASTNATDATPFSAPRRPAAIGMQAVPAPHAASANTSVAGSAAARSADETRPSAEQIAAPLTTVQRLAARRRASVRERRAKLTAPAATGGTGSGPERNGAERAPPAGNPSSTARSADAAPFATAATVGDAAATQSVDPHTKARGAGSARGHTANPVRSDAVEREAFNRTAAAVDELAARVPPAMAAAAVAEPRLDDSLEQQLTEAAYRHGLDLT